MIHESLHGCRLVKVWVILGEQDCWVGFVLPERSLCHDSLHWWIIDFMLHVMRIEFMVLAGPLTGVCPHMDMGPGRSWFCLSLFGGRPWAYSLWWTWLFIPFEVFGRGGIDKVWWWLSTFYVQLPTLDLHGRFHDLIHGIFLGARYGRHVITITIVFNDRSSDLAMIRVQLQVAAIRIDFVFKPRALLTIFWLIIPFGRCGVERYSIIHDIVDLLDFIFGHQMVVKLFSYF